MTNSRFRSLLNWTGESLFVTDLVVLAIAGFFVVLGVIDPLASPILLIAAVVAIALAVMRRRWAGRHPHEVNLALRRGRERRGF